MYIQLQRVVAMPNPWTKFALNGSEEQGSEEAKVHRMQALKEHCWSWCTHELYPTTLHGLGPSKVERKWNFALLTEL
jgi:hypothetical protein